MNPIKPMQILPVLAASLLLAACATTPGSKTAATGADDSSHATLKQRAQQRWDYLINHEAEKAYDYLTPGYRQTISRESYAANMNNRPVQWTGATVGEVTCEQPAVCQVTVKVEYQVQMPQTGGAKVKSSIELNEGWLLLDGQWYHLPNKAGGLTG